MIELRSTLARLEEEGNLRRLPQPSGGVDFSSNDYLGLADHPSIREQLCAALKAGLPLGAKGSRLLGGNCLVIESVEAELSEVFARESALLFSSGFSANLGVMSALGDQGTTFFSDQFNHASLIDGMRVTPAQRMIFQHANMNHLEDLLRQAKASRRRVIVTESVFSMDGDLAPLDELRALADRYDAWLVIDEAHATGVFGKNGLGRCEGMRADNLLVVHTGGKALGAQGAFVMSSRAFRELMVNRARSFVFSTAISPILATQLRLAVRLVVEDGGKMGAALLLSAAEFRKQASAFTDIGLSQSQIVPVIVGGNTRVLRLAEFVRARGFEVRAVRTPTVAAGSERLRITLRFAHTAAEREGLLAIIKEGIAHEQ